MDGLMAYTSVTFYIDVQHKVVAGVNENNTQVIPTLCLREGDGGVNKCNVYM